LQRDIAPIPTRITMTGLPFTGPTFQKSGSQSAVLTRFFNANRHWRG